MLLEKARSPEFWEKVRTSPAYAPFIEKLLEVWEQNCLDDIPAEKFSIFMSYHLTGSRKEYQKPSLTKRRALVASAMLALIYPDEEKYFAKLCDTIWAILGEYIWVAPAHMPTFEENLVHHIDLYAAETGASLAEIDYIFGDRMPPLLRSRIAAEIQRRIIDSYMGDKRYWWEQSPHNWSAVCVGCVTVAILLQRPELFPVIRPRVEETLECFLSGFPEDGICLEGFGYWGYGFGYFTVLADMLRDFTNGEINYFTRDKVKRVASFPQRMYLDGQTTVSFSDAGSTGHWHIGLLHYLKREFPDTVHLPDRSLSYFTETHGRWCMTLRGLLWFDEMLASEASEVESTDYAPCSGWLIKRTARYAFAGKGGCNREPHNHNDLGSFIVTAGGRQVLCDPGAGEYKKGYFGATRYESFKASSRGHSVPIIDGTYQMPGEEHRAPTAYEDGIFTLELAGAYGLDSLTSLKRQFRFDADCITLTDTYTFDGDARPAVERFVTRTEPKITPAGVELDTLTLIADAEVSVHKEEGVWCIDYALENAHVFELKILV